MKALVRTVAIALLSGSACASAQQWIGNARIHDQAVPVQLSISEPKADGSVTGSFLNGDESTVSNQGILKDGHLILNFDYFARKLEGDIKDGRLEATFSGTRGAATALVLQKEVLPPRTKAGDVSKIAGDWEVAVQSPKGESAWTLRVSPPTGKTGEARAVVLRIDGDTGGLYGGYDPAIQQYRFSRFSASGAQAYGVKLEDAGTITLTNLLRSDQRWTGRRPDEARKQQLAPPTNAAEQTTIVDPSQPPRFLSARSEWARNHEQRSKVRGQGSNRGGGRQLVPELP